MQEDCCDIIFADTPVNAQTEEGAEADEKEREERGKGRGRGSRGGR